MAEMGFWRDKPLSQLNAAEWEALCDGCGLCCLVKLEDEASGEFHYTMLACNELNLDNCRCRHYESRLERVADCVALTPASLGDYPWLPSSCAYRRLAAGESLPKWHPLLSGKHDTVLAAGITACSFAIPEREAEPGLDIEEYLLEENP